MPCRSHSTTSSRFERRVLGGRNDLLFRAVFGGVGAAARFFGVSKMTVWRWRHDRAPLPKRVIEALPELIQERVAEAHLAQTEFGYFLREPPKPLSFEMDLPVLDHRAFTSAAARSPSIRSTGSRAWAEGNATNRVVGRQTSGFVVRRARLHEQIEC